IMGKLVAATGLIPNRFNKSPSKERRYIVIENIREIRATIILYGDAARMVTDAMLSGDRSSKTLLITSIVYKEDQR
ncbi:hypothetical protein MKW94_016383, partial [Papaver nudicaule]|nr:hypothetical protein [Papaver nudicaule]